MKTVQLFRNNYCSIYLTGLLSSQSGIFLLCLAMANLVFNHSVSATPTSAMVKIDTRLYNNSNTMLDANVVVFDLAYSNAVDGDDAPKMSNSGENIAIQRGASVLVVEGRQPAVANDAVPFKMWNMHQQNYRLEFIAANLVTPGLTVMLEDAFLNTSTIINPNGSTSINFTVNSNSGTSAANRFRIVFKQAVPLPVTFLSVAANKTTAAVIIDWKVTAQVNTRNYEVQRSADGRIFSTIGSVPALISSSDISYSLTDVTAPTGLIYYRIKSVDTDGKGKYSSIVKMSTGDVRQGFSIVSNIVDNSMINIQFKNQPAGKYGVQLVNNAGQVLMSGSVNYSGGSSNQLLNLPATAAAGIYHLLIVTPGNTRIIQSVVVNNR